MTPAERAVIAAAVRWAESQETYAPLYSSVETEERLDALYFAVAKLVKERKGKTRG